MITADSGIGMKRNILYCPSKHLSWTILSLASKKALYVTCVKVTNTHLLSGVMSSNGLIFLEWTSPPKVAGGHFTKRPIDKRTGDLQWRIVHGAIATNRHVLHLNPNVGVGVFFALKMKKKFIFCTMCTVE